MAYDIEYARGHSWPLLRIPRSIRRLPASLSPAPRPGLIVLHGSEGALSGWSDVVAVELAYRGFVTYAHPYSRGGNVWQAGDIIEYPLEETAQAMRWLRAHPATNGKLGLWGGSRGAEHALLLTSLLARDQPDDLPDAVIAQSPSDTIVGGVLGASLAAADRKATWDPSMRAWSWRHSSEDLKPTTPIEIERYAGPLMLTAGAKDPMWSQRPDQAARATPQSRRARARGPHIPGGWTLVRAGAWDACTSCGPGSWNGIWSKVASSWRGHGRNPGARGAISEPILAVARCNALASLAYCTLRSGALISRLCRAKETADQPKILLAGTNLDP